jgi:hypothetical protein
LCVGKGIAEATSSIFNEEEGKIFAQDWIILYMYLALKLSRFESNYSQKIPIIIGHRVGQNKTYRTPSIKQILSINKKYSLRLMVLKSKVS